MLRDGDEITPTTQSFDPPYSPESLSQSIENWKAKLKEIEESHSCTTSHLKNLISMLRNATEERELFKALMLKEKERKSTVSSQLEYFKSELEQEKKKRKDLQELVKTSLPHLQPSANISKELQASLERDENIPEAYSEAQFVPSLPSTPILTEKINRLSLGYESSLVSEDSTYRQTTGSKELRNFFFDDQELSPSAIPLSPLHSLPFSDPLEQEPPSCTTKWFKAKEVEEAIVELRKKKELLFKETESILLYKRELMAEIDLLEHHKSILMDTKSRKQRTLCRKQRNGYKDNSENHQADSEKNFQKESDVIRSSHQGIPFDTSSPFSPNPEQRNSDPMMYFPSAEPGTSGSKECSQLDSGFSLTSPEPIPGASSSLPSSIQTASRRASFDPYLHEVSGYPKRNKKNGKFQLGFSTVSNAITKIKDKLSNDDNSIAFSSLNDPNSHINEGFPRSKDSNATNLLNGEDMHCAENDYKPHLFGILRLPAVLPCGVCHLHILEMHSKELRCLQCGVAVHARCAPLLKESCSSTSNSTSSSSSFSNNELSQGPSSKQRYCAHSVPSPRTVTSKLSLLPLTMSTSYPSTFHMTSSPSPSSSTTSSSSSSSSSSFSPSSGGHSSKMFGVDLVQQVFQERRSIPLILEFCLSTVEAFGGLGFEGVYRKSGPAHCIRALVQAFDQGVIPDLRAASFSPCSDSPKSPTAGRDSIPVVDVCVTTSVLKQYLRELPNPLITFAIYPVICNAINKHPSKVKEALQASPKPHWDTLAYLFRHLKLIVEHASINRMSSRNLGVVFGPTLMRHASHKDVYDMSGIQVVEYLLDHYVEIFGNSPSFPSLPTPDPSPLAFAPVRHDRKSCELSETEKNASKKHRRVSVVF